MKSRMIRLPITLVLLAILVSPVPRLVRPQTAVAMGDYKPLAAEGYNGPPLIWPFATGHNWEVTAGYNTPYHGGDDHSLGNRGDKFTFDLVRADGTNSTGQVVYAAQDGKMWLDWILRVKDANNNLTDYYVYYGHMVPYSHIRMGVDVTKGQPLGIIDSQRHLHFGVARWNGSGSPTGFPSNAGWVPVYFRNICGKDYPFNGGVNEYSNTVIELCDPDQPPIPTPEDREIPRIGDFNGDGYDDIVTFVSDESGDVYVALNNGGTGFGPSAKWHDWFAPKDEIPAVGDFNNDGYDDIVTFTSDAKGDVYVALNNGGKRFGSAAKWHDWFAPGDEVPAVGDLNGDGYDDIVTFTSDAKGDVYVALNSGGRRFGSAAKWHDWFAPGDEVPAVGDFNSDGYDDIVTFVSDGGGWVWVALNNGGTGFGTGHKWHSYFAPNDEIPAVGDLNNDGYDDIVTFTSDAKGDVYVALNNGGKRFGSAAKWHDWFAPGDEVPAVGDLNGDGYDDIVTFTSDAKGDVYVALNNGGKRFGSAAKWHDWFAPLVSSLLGK